MRPDPKTMTASQINRELDALDERRQEIDAEFIEAGRGDEHPIETLRMSDPLALRYREFSDRHMRLRIEVAMRYGPGAPDRLPIERRHFGPRAKGEP